LLASPAFAELLQQVRRKYEIIIVDAPPLQFGSAILELCDSTIAVVRSQHTKMTDVDRLSGALSQASNVFFVLNAVSKTDRESTATPAIAGNSKRIYAIQPHPTRTAANS
jgi:Mrp family chromosome partitioning ATPase